MNAARDEMLGRIRSALRDVPASEHPEDVVIARDYRLVANDARTELVEQFTRRLVDYKAKVQRVSEAKLPDTLAAACSARSVRRLIVPADVSEDWAPPGIEVLRDERLTYAQLDSSDGVLTGCALAIAQTGTIVLDHGPLQGRRAITLLP